VDVVGDTTDDQGLTSEVVHRTAENVKQFIPPSISDHRLSALR